MQKKIAIFGLRLLCFFSHVLGQIKTPKPIEEFSEPESVIETHKSVEEISKHKNETFESVEQTSKPMDSKFKILHF